MAEEITGSAFYKTRQITDFKDLLTQSCSLYGERPAFKYIENDTVKQTTFSNLYEDVNSLGTALYALGLKGEKTAIISGNSRKWCTAYFAVTNGTGVVVPVDCELMSREMLNILSFAECRAVFFDAKGREKLNEIREELPRDMIYISFDESEDGELDYDNLIEIGREGLKGGCDDFINADIDAKALSSLIFTSGTTGDPKGVMLSQFNICSDIMSLAGVVKITPEDSVLSVLPLHHTYECSLSFLMLLYSGGCLCFCRGLRYIQKDMLVFEPTLFVTVPLMLEKFHAKIMKKITENKLGRLTMSLSKLTSSPDGIMANIIDKAFYEVRKQFGGKLRLIITGAAAISPEVAEDFKTFGIPVYIGYGLTECSPLVIGNNDRLQMTDGVGVPLPDVKMKIGNPDDNGVGEILIKGPMVMMGYYKNKDATDEVFDSEGWFHTGDMGSVDKDGHCRISGRSKNVIVTKNGKNIYPEEVEFYLNTNPYISESLVFGSDVANEEEGTRVEAKIFPDVAKIKEKLKGKKQPTKEEISEVVMDAINDVNKKLPKYKRIKNFDIREREFKKTTTSKIKRHENLRNDE